MEDTWCLSSDRIFTEEERALIWEKPASHADSDAERRICSAVKRNWNRGELAVGDMKQVIQEYSRKGILFLAAAIGQDTLLCLSELWEHFNKYRESKYFLLWTPPFSAIPCFGGQGT